MLRKVLILGASSAIALETAKLFSLDGDCLFLVARDARKLESVANDLRVRGAGPLACFEADLSMCEQHEDIIHRAIEFLGGLDVILIAYGTLGNQKAAEESFPVAERELKTNFLSVVSWLTILANYCERKRYGCIVVITSVAGDRGRKTNYVYGTAKGALSIFLQGLRNRLHEFDVRVITVKPGFVDTPMTAAFPKGALFTTPDQVAAGIYRAIKDSKDIVYLPFFWRPIMTVIKLLPERIFKKMRF